MTPQALQRCPNHFEENSKVRSELAFSALVTSFADKSAASVRPALASVAAETSAPTQSAAAAIASAGPDAKFVEFIF